MSQSINLLFPIIIVIIMMVIFCWEMVSDLQIQFTLHKFILQKNTYFRNKKIFVICYASFVFCSILSCLVLIGLVISLVLNWQQAVLFNSLTIIIYLLFVVINHYLWKYKASSMVIIFKNQQLVIYNKVISYDKIERISNDMKRKKILIQYYDKTNQLCLQLIDYHWELKDLIVQTKLKHNFT